MLAVATLANQLRLRLGSQTFLHELGFAVMFENLRLQVYSGFGAVFVICAMAGEYIGFLLVLSG